MSEDTSPPIGWAILELMGHRKLAGMVTEQEIAGKGFIRIDIFTGEAPEEGEELPVATQLYSPGAVYCITPTTEEMARNLSARHKPAPVARYELEPVAATSSAREFDDDDDLTGPGF